MKVFDILVLFWTLAVQIVLMVSMGNKGRNLAKVVMWMLFANTLLLLAKLVTLMT